MEHTTPWWCSRKDAKEQRNTGFEEAVREVTPICQFKKRIINVTSYVK